MVRIKQILIYVVIFFVSTWISFLFEERFRQLIRYFYVVLTSNRISFLQPGKYFHFPSELYVLSFGVFVLVIYHLLTTQTNNQRVKSMTLVLMAFVVSVIITCYIDGIMKIAICTACSDGTRILRYNDIKYDQIFVSSLIIATIPPIITALKQRIKKRRYES
jgi:glycerol uptake facilitator-like aquaporin